MERERKVHFGKVDGEIASNQHPRNPGTPMPPDSNKIDSAQAAKRPDPISEAPELQWYVIPPGAQCQYGPAAGDTLRAWVNEGRVPADSLVWRQDWPGWQRAGSVFPDLESCGATPKTRNVARAPILQHDDESNSLGAEFGRRDTLLPQRISDLVGHREVRARLAIALDVARKRGDALGHILFEGPPGIGKSTLANVIPRELAVTLQIASGNALRAPRDVVPFLTNAEDYSVLFIDEIHRVPSAVQELLCPAMDSFGIEIDLSEGVNARTINMPLRPFTLIGATSRPALLSERFRQRFAMREHLDFYSVDELAEIVRRNATALGSPLEAEALVEIAARSRGTPRLANSRLRWVRDYATSKGDGRITLELARAALEMQGIDARGLDTLDRSYLATIINLFDGGPAGMAALAGALGVDRDSLDYEVEPYLLRAGLLVRTPRGRKATRAAYEHLGVGRSGTGGHATLF
jgi:Holliday junction DNA helicase RuvB